MPKLKAAHINEQGQNMIIFPLDGAFGIKTHHARSEMLEELERRAHAAGLAGRAVAIWERGNQTHFLGPRPWQGFFQSISLRWVMANINKEISW
jgi:hypothetical protein